MPPGRHRPQSDPTPGIWLLVVLLLAAGAFLWTQRQDLLELLGFAERPVTEVPPARGPLTIQVAGRLAADAGRIRGADRPDGPPWEGIRPVLGRDDLTVVPLACAVAPASDREGGCEPAMIETLPEIGVEAVALANEGVAALGPDAQEATLRALREAGVRSVGAGGDLRAAWRPLVLEEAGWRVGVLAATEAAPVEHAAAEGRPGVADARDLEPLTERVGRLREQVDVLLVLLHWEMADDGPDEEQTARARALIDAGADAVIAHTPGVLRRMDRYRGRLIFWSLDDLLRPVDRGPEVHSALARVVVGTDGTLRGRLVPLAIEPPGRAVLRGR